MAKLPSRIISLTDKLVPQWLSGTVYLFPIVALMFAVFRRRWKPKSKRAGSGHKHKEKNQNEGSETPDSARDNGDRASKTGHQVHPEHRPAITIDKVNVMVNLDGKWDKKDLETSPLGDELDPLEKVHFSPVVNKDPPGKSVQNNSGKEPHAKVHIASFTNSMCHENRVSTDSVAFSDRDTWISGQSDKEVWMHSQSEKDSCQSDHSSFESDKSGSWAANESETENGKCSYSPRERPIGEDRDHTEKTDVIKELLEKRVLELERLLEKEKRNDSHVQQELLQKELEKEKAQRKEVEIRLQEISRENEFAKMRLSKLQQDFIKLEEMVCGMIQYKSRMDWLQQEKNALSLTYETQLRKYQNYISNLEKENLMLLGEVKSLEASNRQSDDRERSLSQVLLERLRYLETENSSLVLETEQQRLQYERCLDEVANQVVQALLMQKGLREECTKLRKHVGDLEHHNRFLKLMFQKQINLSNDSALQACRPSSSGAESHFSNTFVTVNNVQSPSLSSGKFAKQSHQKGTSNHSSMATQTSHSEDSLESLASLCSEYSLHSNGSGNLHNNTMGINIPGMPQLSSPPLWIKECLAQCRVSVSSRQSQDCEDISTYMGLVPNEGTLKPSDEVEGLFESIWPGLQLKDLEELVCSEESLRYSESNKSSDKTKTDKKNEAKNPSDGDCSKEENREKPDEEEDEGSLEKSPSLASLSEALDSSSSACLDAVETPNEEALNFVNLPLLVSSQKLHVSVCPNPIESVSKTIESIGIPFDTMGENMQQRIRDAVTRTIALRPKSLNLVPQHTSDKQVMHKELIGHHYDYPSLEIKNHPVCAGNVYTSPNAKPFPLQSIENPPLMYEKSRYSDEKVEVSKKPIETDSNRCLCKSSEKDVVDSPSKYTPTEGSCAKNYGNPLKFQTTPRGTDDNYKLSDSMLSTDGSVRDEGYSTMSSDVICEQQSGISSLVKSNSMCTEATTSPSTVSEVLNKQTDASKSVNCDLSNSVENRLLDEVQHEDEMLPDEDDTEEEIHGFENDLVQSLILVKDSKTKDTISTSKCSSPIDKVQNSQGILKETSEKIKHVTIQDPKFTINGSLKEMDNKSVTNSNLILSTNRMVSLCAPQGFKARPPHITFPPPHNVEMADKETETEPLNSKDINLSGSFTSLASIDSEGHEKFPPDFFESRGIGASDITAGSQRSSFASASDSDCYDLLPNSSLLLGCNKLNELKIVEDNDSDEFFMPILCKLCPEKKLQTVCQRPVFKPRKIEKSVSDSDLYLMGRCLQTQFSCSASTSSCNEITHFSPRSVITTGSLEFPFDGRNGQYEGGLWRSKATVSLADDEDEQSKPHLTAHDVSSWQYEMTGQSLLSLQSIASEEGDSKREATACKLLTEDMLVNSDSDRESLIEDDSFSSSWPAVSENCLISRKPPLTKENHIWNLETVHEVSSEGQQTEEPPQQTSLQVQKEASLTEGNSDGEWKEMMGGMSRTSWLTSKGFPLPEYLTRSGADVDPAESIQSSEDSDLRTVGTEFHSDFYHLCKVDSRSLNMSCKSLSVSEGGSIERESTTSRNHGQDDNEKTKVLPDELEKPCEVVLSETSEVEGNDIKGSKILKSSDDLIKHDPSVIQDSSDKKNRSVVEEGMSDDSSQDGGENAETNVGDNSVQCTLQNKASTREKLEELSAMLAESCGAEEDDETAVHGKEQMMGSPGRKEGCTTSWVHVETDVDLTDPKARANLLDTMLASSSSSSSSECGEELPEYHHLHQLHRYRRHRKATELENCMLRYIPPTRPSILGRRDFFFRYGEQEQAAVASFDFLEDMSTSVSDFGSAETLNVNEEETLVIDTKCENSCQKEMTKSFWSPKCPSSADKELQQTVMSIEQVPGLFRSDCNGSTTTLNSHDFDAPERLSLSDSCAESYSSSNQSLNAME